MASYNGEELTTEERSRIRRERLAERNAMNELIRRSSLGTPHARRMIDQASADLKRAAEESLTGAPEEQADWEADG